MKNQTATFVKSLLHDACSKHVSDIHFCPHTEKEDVPIYFRIYGIRQYEKSISFNVYQSILTYLKFSSNMDIGEIRKPQNGTLSFKDSSEVSYSLRLSTLPINKTESLSIRILPQEKSPIFNQLFLFPKQMKQMMSWLNNKTGIILLTGPTGSGKTTTMYALIESMIENHSIQVITLEDPIERKINSLLQVEINEKAGITYQTGLKAALRHDPDVLLIGEIRDERTAQFVVRAALTGHLVLTTLHAKNAIGTIDRLIELGISRTELAQTVRGIGSLELLPIYKGNRVYRRAAIGELLEGRNLLNVIKGVRDVEKTYDTFEYLKEKAYLYGFISKDYYEAL